ncbi:MAG TPA: SDR family NAD(P)-dependent oxidoreductase [Anaerolineae bacterium]|nr:SDR family NAD(P)-dependent oxidoreductase [Anaerolineae bacterium]
MTLNPPTALITGAAGFCGSYLAELLAEQGWRVVGLDMAADAGERLRRLGLDIPVCQADLADTATLQQIVADVQPDQVYHLAALTNPAAPYQALYEANVFGTIHLLEAVRQAAPDAVLLIAGSSAQYGPTAPHENPIGEGQEFRPITQYAVTKAAQDLLGHMAGAAGQRVIRTRSFNIIGPRQGAQFVTGAFARQIAEIEQGRRPPLIEVGNLAAVRDFVDVRDVARAYALALAAGRPGQAYNVCSGAGRSVQSLLDSLLALSTAKSIEVRPVAERMQPADVPAQVGSYARLAADTGWQPLIPWEQTLRDLLNYWRAAVAGDQ